jgi:HAD superfamily hydrolase (TIGR01490 family)
MSIAFFDLDGTILPGTSSERLFFRDLLRQRRLGMRQLAAFLFFSARWHYRFGGNVWKKNKAYLCGLPVDWVAARAEAFVNDAIMPRCCPLMKERIAEHANCGDTLVLLTGTLECLAAPIARHLDMDLFRASRCVVAADRYTAKPPLQHPYGEEKVHIALAVCDQLQLPLDRSAAYGDSGSDRFLLSHAGRPVAVHPDHALRRIAAASGWEVIP